MDEDTFQLQDRELLIAMSKVVTTTLGYPENYFPNLGNVSSEKMTEAQAVVEKALGQKSTGSSSAVATRKKEHKLVQEGDTSNSVSEKIKFIISNRLNAIHDVLKENDLDDQISLKYSINAKGKEGNELVVDGHLLQQ